MKVLVTGGDSQLALTIKDHVEYYKSSLEDEYIFCTHKELDITDPQSISESIAKYTPSVIINCAAYNDVEKSEDEFQKAIDINCFGVDNLVKACEEHKILLIHISTDYVYKSSIEYIDSRIIPPCINNEDSELDPLSKYALSKYLGEKMCIGHKGIVIIRTSWLYSNYGKNFVKTIINKINNNETISVVTDQYGRPTCADDLADFIMFVIVENRLKYLYTDCEIYNFQNGGPGCSWYEFACAIYDFYTNKYAMPYGHHEDWAPIERIYTSDFKCKAVRPKCSVMSLDKISNLYNVTHWELALRQFITRMSCV